MKNTFLFLLIIMLLQTCSLQEDKPEKNYYQFNSYDKYFKEVYVKKFINDFIELPENNDRILFTLYLDQREDTLLMTIFKAPILNQKLDEIFGYFYCKNKLVLIYSSFSRIIGNTYNDKIEKEIFDIYKMDFEKNKKINYKTMWQLQIPYYDSTYYIQKDFYTIQNTIKPPIPQ